MACSLCDEITAPVGIGYVRRGGPTYFALQSLWMLDVGNRELLETSFPFALSPSKGWSGHNESMG